MSEDKLRSLVKKRQSLNEAHMMVACDVTPLLSICSKAIIYDNFHWCLGLKNRVSYAFGLLNWLLKSLGKFGLNLTFLSYPDHLFFLYFILWLTCYWATFSVNLKVSRFYHATFWFY
ncbi:hypothetical protein HanHA89_Chr06g0240611 [Helianthus annuus]|nr:hypothetical protein HanHA89_Chr06g0240611 [Helianthus annuus]